MCYTWCSWCCTVQLNEGRSLGVDLEHTLLHLSQTAQMVCQSLLMHVTTQNITWFSMQRYIVNSPPKCSIQKHHEQCLSKKIIWKCIILTPVQGLLSSYFSWGVLFKAKICLEFDFYFEKFSVRFHSSVLSFNNLNFC